MEAPHCGCREHSPLSVLAYLVLSGSCPCDQCLSSVLVDVKLKVQSLLVQWVRRFVTAQSSWSVFVHFWFFTVFNSSPVEVFSRPFAFSPRALPPFYQSLLLAWRAVDGSFSRSRAALVMALVGPSSVCFGFCHVCQVALSVFAVG